MKKTSLFAVVLYGICAVIWTVRAVVEIIYKTYQDSMLMFILSMLCAVVWVVAFLASLMKYRAGRDENPCNTENK